MRLDHLWADEKGSTRFLVRRAAANDERKL
jgi:hypothetical protein